MVSNLTDSAPIGPVDYADTDAGDRRGWIFDFDISSNAAAQRILQDPEATFSLQHAQYGTVLAETDYYFVSNQQGIYAEQHGPGDSFLNQGTSEPATVSVYHRGRELRPAECPPITVWQYRSVPIQSPGNVEAIATNFKPGQPLQVDTSQPGNFLFTFSIDDAANPVLTGFPPQSYNTFMFPPYITNAPSISLRILPNDEDFSSYYVDPSAAEPVGNDRLTFDVVYQKVLRTYYLLYPVMNLCSRSIRRRRLPRMPRPSSTSTDADKQWMSRSVHAAHPRHVRQPPHAPPGLVPEGPRGRCQELHRVTAGHHPRIFNVMMAGHHACRRTARAQPHPTAISIQPVARDGCPVAGCDEDRRRLGLDQRRSENLLSGRHVIEIIDIGLA